MKFRDGARAFAFVLVALFLVVFPLCTAFAQGDRARSAGAGSLFRLQDSSSLPDATAAPGGQALPPADGEGGPGSGPPAGVSGSGLISGLMVAGVIAALVISGFLISKIYKKDK